MKTIKDYIEDIPAHGTLSHNWSSVAHSNLQTWQAEADRLKGEIERLRAIVEDLKTELLDRVDKSVKLVEQQAEIERLQEERDLLEWLLDTEYQRENPGTPIPCWITTATSMKQAAEAERGG